VDPSSAPSELHIIALQRVTKTYRIGMGRARIREMLPPPIDGSVARIFPRWWTKDAFNALEDVSLCISAGSSVGIIGHNGAGKTTLLKLIARVTAPTEGSVATSGRIGALIDALIAFNLDLSGGENVYLVGAMCGLGRRDVTARLDRILEFAEIEPAFLEMPVKRLSAGMWARLGFATATALDTDILLVDEVLAVGDASFQTKCVHWLDEYRERGGTLLLVSHNLGLVQSMTERVVWLDRGRVVGDGPPSEILRKYARASEHRDLDSSVGWQGRGRTIRMHGLDRWGAGGARVSAVQFQEKQSFDGQGLDVSISYQASTVKRAVFCVGFIDEGGAELGAASSPLVALDGEQGQISCIIRPLPLRPGIYFPVVGIVSEDGHVRDRWKLDRAIVVEDDAKRPALNGFGPVEVRASWSS